MLYQRDPLPPEVDYFLDAANEADEIGTFAHAALNLLGDRQVVKKIIDRIMPNGNYIRGRGQKCLDLDAYAHELVADLAPHEQRSFVACGMRWEPLHLVRIAEYLIHYNFEDTTRGGCALPYRRYRRHDDAYDPTPRARRKLYAPASIRRYVKAEDQSVPMSRTMAGRLRQLPAALPADSALVNDLRLEQREAYRVEYHAAKMRFEAEQRRKYGTYGSVTPKDRKVARRAALFCAGLLGAEAVGAFARGEAIALPAQDYTLQVARSRSVASVGHGALDVRLCLPDGTRMANICVYFDGTPALDQLAAIAMHVRAGAAGEIIKTGNLFNISNEGASHPVVKERMARIPAFDAAAVERMMHRGVSQSEHDRQLAAMRRYQADVLPVYVRALRDHVWGRDAARLNPFIDLFTPEERGEVA